MSSVKGKRADYEVLNLVLIQPYRVELDFSYSFKLLWNLFWIGLYSVKISYNYLVQAIALLQKNLDNAKASLEVLVADLQLLTDQVTI